MAFASSVDVEFLSLTEDEKGAGVLQGVLDAQQRGDDLTEEEQRHLEFKLRGLVVDGDSTLGVKLKFHQMKKLLKVLLQTAIGIELTTIPPYLTALYSIRTGIDEHNDKARENIQNVVVEEMLHAGLAANVLKSIGGHPEAYVNNIAERQAFTSYPVRHFFQRGDDVESRALKILPANIEALDAFVAIETEGIKVAVSFAGKTLKYGTISDFYDDITDLLVHCELQAMDRGESIFLHKDEEDQIGEQLKEYYFEYPPLQVVYNIEDALDAINTITWQGEGSGTPPPHERDPTHAQWFIETRTSLEEKTFDIYEDHNNIGDPQWAAVNEFFNAGYTYQLMEFELLYQTSSLQMSGGVNVGIQAKQKKAYFGMGVLMCQFLRPLAIFMLKNGAYPTWEFHQFQSDPVSNGTPQDQFQALGKTAAAAARTANDDKSAAFLDEMVLSLFNIADGVSQPPQPHRQPRKAKRPAHRPRRDGDKPRRRQRELRHPQFASARQQV